MNEQAEARLIEALSSLKECMYMLSRKNDRSPDDRLLIIKTAGLLSETVFLYDPARLSTPAKEGAR